MNKVSEVQTWCLSYLFLVKSNRELEDFFMVTFLREVYRTRNQPKGGAVRGETNYQVRKQKSL